MQDSFNQQQATACNNAPHTLLVVQLLSFQAPQSTKTLMTENLHRHTLLLFLSLISAKQC